MKINTNQLEVEFNFENINNDFDIFKISTDKKFIKDSTYIIDKPLLESGAKSIVWDGGKDIYILFEKNKIIVNGLKRICRGDILEDELKFEKIRAEKLKQHVLTQLLINSIRNTEKNGLNFNNLSGNFYYFTTELLRQGKNKKVYCIEFKVNKEMKLNLNVVTFTSLKLKKEIKFDKKMPNQYPKYTISKSDNIMRRILPSEQIKIEEQFIKRQTKNERKFIDFYNFENLQSFNSSKIGCLANIFKRIKMDLSQYMNLFFEEREVIKPFEVKNESKNLKKYIKELGISKSIVIIDKIKTDESNIFMNKLIDIFKNLNIEVKEGKRKSKDKFNIFIIDSADKYAKNNKEDQYEKATDGYVIQNIVLNDKKIDNTVIINILKELIIKEDIKNRKITLDDWKKYNYKNPWTFVQKYKDKYLSMIIQPDGTFSFNIEERDLFNYQEYEEIFNEKPNEKIVDNNYINGSGLVINHLNQKNYISDTNLFTIPNFEEMEKYLEKMKDSNFYLKDNIIKYLNSEEMKNNLKHENIIELNETIEKVEEISSRKLTQNELKSLVKNKAIRKELNNILDKEEGKIISLEVRGEEIREDILNSNIDIKYIQSDNKNEMYYFVGVIGAGMNTKIERSSLLYKINTINESPIFFEKLLPLMNVEFVRLGQLTIMPFPFKYLREYSKNI